ncbi:MAG: SRPBCC family protein [Cyanobacteria bacterium J06600_6]
MNRQTLIRSATTIFCVFSLLGISLNSSRYSIAQAQNRVNSETSLNNLSSQETKKLEQGEVILKGQKGKYLGRVIASGNIDTAWQVLTDYDNFDRFLPNISASKIIEENGDRILFEQINLVDLWLFQEEFVVQIEAVKTKPSKVDFELANGELKKLVGRWSIEEISPGEILVSHKVEVEPGSDTEKLFFYGIYESSLEETLKAIAVEITRRSSK